MKNQNSLRIFIILFCISLMQGSSVFADEKLTITHGPYLIDPGENAITVVWFTNNKCVSWVEFCGDRSFGTFPTWGGYPQIARSSHHGLIDANTKMHSIRIMNLKPGIKYRYRVVSKEILRFEPYEVLFGDTVVGDVLEFETLNSKKENFSFGVVTDVHDQSARLDTLLLNNPVDSLDMMFLIGDILSWIKQEDQIFNGFLDVAVQHFAKEKPFIFTRGNHETRGSFARNLMPYFPHSSGKFYYSFDHGHVHFIVLDPGEDKPDTHPVYAGLVDFDAYRDEQAAWLKKDIQTENFNKAKYKIALFHIPLFSGSKGHGARDITEKWGPILNNAGIDLVINGHHHRYAKILPTKGKNNFPIMIIGKDMILKVDVSNDQLSLSINNKEGDNVDRFSIPSTVQ